MEARDLKQWRVEAREREPRCAAARGRHVGRVIRGIEPLSGAWGHVQSPTALRLSRLCRSAQDDLYGTFKTVIEAILCSGDANGSGLCSVKLLNDGGCRSET